MYPWGDKWARVRQASWSELATRGRQELAKRWDHYVFPRFPHSPTPRESARTRGHFFFASSDVPRIAAAITKYLPGTVERVVHEAEKICRRRFDLLGYEELDFGDPINWHLDAVNGKISPQKPFYKIPFLRFDEVGDVKVIWELNRHQHLVTLARAFCFTGDLRFAHEIVAQWYAWRKENPYPRGVNWASSLEIAFRCLSWLWVRHLLADSAVIPPQFWDDLDQALLLGGRHIERYLSFYFSPNTHLLGEAVALFFLGVLCGGGRTTDRWRSTGWEIVQSQAERQV